GDEAGWTLYLACYADLLTPGS
ncbi:MAG: hypothetical protein JWM05_1960, partial [Acidimicrobiales bacterium]|nr:hypothetical protein [Acidimicrobiales bacterium]